MVRPLEQTETIINCEPNKICIFSKKKSFVLDKMYSLLSDLFI